jgi:hypothetical protein
MDRNRVRWEIPHNIVVHRIVVGGRIGYVIIIPRGSSNIANLNWRIVRGRRVLSIALDRKLWVGSRSVKHGCNVEKSLDPRKFIVGNHDT